MTDALSAETVPRAVERVFRQESGQVLATLIGWLGGDFELAEDALQDALVMALSRWGAQGIPRKPGAWLTLVARRKAIDRLRHAPAGRTLALDELPDGVAAVEDDLDRSAMNRGDGRAGFRPLIRDDPDRDEAGRRVASWRPRL